jgi:hypothetical protein
VHYLSRVYAWVVDESRDLTPEEQHNLLQSVAVHGRRSWPLVGAACGLSWPPWRLLQAFWHAATAADAAQDAEASKQAAAVSAVQGTPVLLTPVLQTTASAGQRNHSERGNQKQHQQQRQQRTTVASSAGQGEENVFCTDACARSTSLDAGEENYDANSTMHQGSFAGNDSLHGTRIVVPESHVSSITLGRTGPQDAAGDSGQLGARLHVGTCGIGVGQRYWQWPEALDDKLVKVVEDLLKSPWAADAHVSWLVR